MVTAGKTGRAGGRPRGKRGRYKRKLNPYSDGTRRDALSGDLVAKFPGYREGACLTTSRVLKRSS